MDVLVGSLISILEPVMVVVPSTIVAAYALPPAVRAVVASNAAPPVKNFKYGFIYWDPLKLIITGLALRSCVAPVSAGP